MFYYLLKVCVFQNLNNGDICDPKLFQQWCHNQNSPGAPCTSAGCRFYKMESDSVITYLHLFNAFGFFWGIWFVSGLSDLILAGTFAKWYWTFDKRRVPFFAVTEATARTLRYVVVNVK